MLLAAVSWIPRESVELWRTIFAGCVATHGGRFQQPHRVSSEITQRL